MQHFSFGFCIHKIDLNGAKQNEKSNSHLKRQNNFCSLFNLGLNVMTSTYLGHYAINLNIWAILQLATTFGP